MTRKEWVKAYFRFLFSRDVWWSWFFRFLYIVMFMGLFDPESQLWKNPLRQTGLAVGLLFLLALTLVSLCFSQAYITFHAKERQRIASEALKDRIESELRVRHALMGVAPQLPKVESIPVCQKNPWFIGWSQHFKDV